MNVEYAKEYIVKEMKESGLDEVKIDFADLCTEEEVIEAVNELGFECIQAEGQGVWWVWK